MLSGARQMAGLPFSPSDIQDGWKEFLFLSHKWHLLVLQSCIVSRHRGPHLHLTPAQSNVSKSESCPGQLWVSDSPVLGLGFPEHPARSRRSFLFKRWQVLYGKEQQKVQRMGFNFTSYLGLIQSPKRGCLVLLEMLWDIYMGLADMVQNHTC